MSRFNARRFCFFLLLVFVVVVLQISLNILLLSCKEETQNTSKRDVISVVRTRKRIQSAHDQRHQHGTAYSNDQAKDYVEDVTSQLASLKEENTQLKLQLSEFKKLEKIISAQEFSAVKSESFKKGFLKDKSAFDETAVNSFDSFTRYGIYSVNKDGLVDRPARRPMGTRIQDHEEILKFAVDVVNDELPGEHKVQQHHLVNGISRLNRLTGMEYDLIFSTGRANLYHRVKVRRPFSNIELVENVETVDSSKEIINLILPLSGRTDKFELFLKRFGDVCVRYDGRVHLTVVYFGEQNRTVVKSLLEAFEKREKFHDYKIIFEEGPFSRGVGLQRGVFAWEKGNNIMFFCDVDVFFNPDFLERCRLYSEPGQMVYYPIVFSLYNPIIVYDGRPPDVERQMYIGKNNGFWRDFGFGMTCMYRNDFVATKGFDTTIQGWGMEDVKLYRKFLLTDLAVIRATDRGIFHMYHPKICDSSLSSEQYMACLRSKSFTEASHKQMGILAFGYRLFSNLEPDWRTRLTYQPDFSLRDTKTTNKEALSLWRRADNLEIESLEVENLNARLKAIANFTMNGEEVLDNKDVVSLQRLQNRLKNFAQHAKDIALNLVKNISDNGG